MSGLDSAEHANGVSENDFKRLQAAALRRET
jgi:hypothetical protein